MGGDGGRDETLFYLGLSISNSIYVANNSLIENGALNMAFFFMLVFK